MHRFARALVVAGVAAAGAVLCGGHALAASAHDDDPLQAPECRRALAALQAAEADARPPGGARRPTAASGIAAAPGVAAASGATRRTVAVDPHLAAARRDVARHCLAARTDPPRSGRLAAPPLAVAPVAAARSPLPPAASGAPPERIPPVQPPVAITSCDSGGCWTSDGARLQRLGPTLWSPRGACSVVGAVVHCP